MKSTARLREEFADSADRCATVGNNAGLLNTRPIGEAAAIADEIAAIARDMGAIASGISQALSDTPTKQDAAKAA